MKWLFQIGDYMKAKIILELTMDEAYELKEILNNSNDYELAEKYIEELRKVL